MENSYPKKLYQKWNKREVITVKHNDLIGIVLDQDNKKAAAVADSFFSLIFAVSSKMHIECNQVKSAEPYDHIDDPG